MSNESLQDDFMKLGDFSSIDNQILAEAAGDNLIERVQTEKNRENEARTPWMQELRAHWFSYALLGLSFLLTEMLAIYLGLAPSLGLDEKGRQVIQFHTDFGHLATAAVYMLVFPIVTEIAFAVSRHKFSKRETTNFNQAWTMAVACFASLVSIIGTGVAGGYVVLSTLGQSGGGIGFVEVPQSAKNWLVWVIPSLIALFALLHAVYDSSSKREKNKKIMEEKDLTDELNDQLRMRSIERAGKRAIRAAAIQAYMKSVRLGLLSQQEADLALSQGKSLAQLEKDLNRDLTGEGLIGNTSGINTPPPLSNNRPAPMLQAPNPVRSQREYSLDELLGLLGMTREQAVGMINKYELTDPTSAYTALGDYLPEDLSLRNFSALYGELVSSGSESVIDWTEVNRRLEDVKKDLIRARDIAAGPNGNGKHF